MRVVVTSPVNARTKPSYSATILKKEPTGTTGTVTGGPVASEGRQWWTIAYDNGVTGWSIEDLLETLPARQATG